MTSKTALPAKRARTTPTANSPKSPRDASEELTQVTNLIEKRRLQNRISQQNYRNKIRVRLEKLEALVDASGLDETKSVDKSRRRQSTARVAHDSDYMHRSQLAQDTKKPEVNGQQLNVPNDRLGYWGPIASFGNPREGNSESRNNVSQMNRLTSNFGSHSMQPSCSASIPIEPFGADCAAVPSSTMFGASKAEDIKLGFCSSGSEAGTTPGTPEIDRIDPKFSAMEIYHGASSDSLLDSNLYGQQVYADSLSLNSVAQLNNPLLPVAPMCYPSSNAEGCAINSSSYNPWGISSFGPSNTLHNQEQQYIWIPFPVSVSTMPSEAVKSQTNPDLSNCWEQ
ncbi:hypothetical protein MMC07_007618 [Pseudocyphellaria aurata]|nr:hypothetical protein [Pseudocyphellaria aurata]